MKTTTDSSEYRPTLMETFKEHLPNPSEMILDLFLQWYDRRRLILSSIILLVIPIFMILIGIFFIHSCAKTSYLPLHMIVCGCTSFIAALYFTGAAKFSKQILRCTSKLNSRLSETIRILLSIFEVICFLICFIGLIVLTVVVIRISQTVELIDRTENFCHPIIYYFSYVLLFLFYTILSFILLILLSIFHAYQKGQ